MHSKCKGSQQRQPLCFTRNTVCAKCLWPAAAVRAVSVVHRKHLCLSLCVYVEHIGLCVCLWCSPCSTSAVAHLHTVFGGVADRPFSMQEGRTIVGSQHASYRLLRQRRPRQTAGCSHSFWQSNCIVAHKDLGPRPAAGCARLLSQHRLSAVRVGTPVLVLRCLACA